MTLGAGKDAQGAHLHFRPAWLSRGPPSNKSAAENTKGGAARGDFCARRRGCLCAARPRSAAVKSSFGRFVGQRLPLGHSGAPAADKTKRRAPGAGTRFYLNATQKGPMHSPLSANLAE